MRIRIVFPPRVLSNERRYCRFVGQMIMVVFDGLSVTPDIQTMIEKYYVGNILLTARNIRGNYCTPKSTPTFYFCPKADTQSDGVQIASLTQELQKIAQAAGFHYPLMIGIEQENGMVRGAPVLVHLSLCDDNGHFVT